MSGKYTLIEVTELERLRHRFDMLAHELTGDEGDDDAEIVIRRAFKEKEDELATVRNDALEVAAKACERYGSSYFAEKVRALKREGGGNG